ncbi:MAG: hypothetical protein O3A06_01240 [Proteobacteria bacterium]|nr:hypothetical protein [Pseudomonadota bacterium]MDA0981666.1 hypothetical protein [Pseudomonadota bacterium]
MAAAVTSQLRHPLFPALIEIYDGPHHHEKPVFHTDATIGDFIKKP